MAGRRPSHRVQCPPPHPAGSQAMRAAEVRPSDCPGVAGPNAQRCPARLVACAGRHRGIGARWIAGGSVSGCAVRWLAGGRVWVGPGVSPSLTGKRVAALTKTGGCATAVLLAAADLVEVPDGIGADEAETLIVNGVTAYQMLHRSAKV